MDFFDTLAFDLDFNSANEAHEPSLPREYDEDAACREFAAINLGFN